MSQRPPPPPPRRRAPAPTPPRPPIKSTPPSSTPSYAVHSPPRLRAVPPPQPPSRQSSLQPPKISRSIPPRPSPSESPNSDVINSVPSKTQIGNTIAASLMRRGPPPPSVADPVGSPAPVKRGFGLPPIEPRRAPSNIAPRASRAPPVDLNPPLESIPFKPIAPPRAPLPSGGPVRPPTSVRLPPRRAPPAIPGGPPVRRRRRVLASPHTKFEPTEMVSVSTVVKNAVEKYAFHDKVPVPIEYVNADKIYESGDPSNVVPPFKPHSTSVSISFNSSLSQSSFSPAIVPTRAPSTAPSPVPPKVIQRIPSGLPSSLPTAAPVRPPSAARSALRARLQEAASVSRSRFAPIPPPAPSRTQIPSPLQIPQKTTPVLVKDTPGVSLSDQIADLEREMTRAISEQRFEDCSALRDQIAVLQLRIEQQVVLDRSSVDRTLAQLDDNMQKCIAEQKFELCAGIRDQKQALTDLMDEFDRCQDNQRKKVIVGEISNIQSFIK